MEHITPDELRKYLPGASASTFKVNSAGLQSPQPEQVVCHEPLAKAPRTAQSPSRYVVRITGYRVRLLDPDNFAGGCKYCVDTLRYAKLIPDDTPECIRLETEQVKVASKAEERTEIEIIRML